MLLLKANQFFFWTNNNSQWDNIGERNKNRQIQLRGLLVSNQAICNAFWFCAHFSLSLFCLFLNFVLFLRRKSNKRRRNKVKLLYTMYGPTGRLFLTFLILNVIDQVMCCIDNFYKLLNIPNWNILRILIWFLWKLLVVSMVDIPLI